MALEPDLREVHPALHQRAREAFLNGDAGSFVSIGRSNQHGLGLVADNIRALKERGIYEACLFKAFTFCRVNHQQWSEAWLDYLFANADPIKLRAAGAPLPGPGPFCLYRGIAGTGRARRLRGYSWTGSLDIACWFATRLHLRQPAVLTASVGPEAVLAYQDDRGEQEFIYKPENSTRVKFAPGEILERAKRHAERMRARSEARRAELIASNLSSARELAR
jgi:hypothetical protein